MIPSKPEPRKRVSLKNSCTHFTVSFPIFSTGGLPFVLRFQTSAVKMCTMIEPPTGYLVITNDCSDLFCKNSLNQIVNIATRKCLSTRNPTQRGLNVAISDKCNNMSVIREVPGGVQLVAKSWHMHPEHTHQNPPAGTRVLFWDYGMHLFYFEYKKNFP